MSRTHKGAKGPGWEPWSNRHEKASEKASYSESHAGEDDVAGEPEICPGCPVCCCLKCGGFMAATDGVPFVTCINCGHQEVTNPSA